MAHVWSLEGRMWESVLVFHDGSGGRFQDGTQVIRLGSQYLYLLRHLDSIELFLNRWDMKPFGTEVVSTSLFFKTVLCSEQFLHRVMLLQWKILPYFWGSCQSRLKVKIRVVSLEVISLGLQVAACFLKVSPPRCDFILFALGCE